MEKITLDSIRLDIIETTHDRLSNNESVDKIILNMLVTRGYLTKSGEYDKEYYALKEAIDNENKS